MGFEICRGSAGWMGGVRVFVRGKTEMGDREDE